MFRTLITRSADNTEQNLFSDNTPTRRYAESSSAASIRNPFYWHSRPSAITITIYYKYSHIIPLSRYDYFSNCRIINFVTFFFFFLIFSLNVRNISIFIFRSFLFLLPLPSSAIFPVDRSNVHLSCPLPNPL